MAEDPTGSTASAMDISWLLSPFPLDEFIAEKWAKAPLRLTRGQSDFYHDLLPEQDLEFALLAASRTAGAVELLSEDDKPVICRSHEQAIAGFRQGKSIRIDSIQRFSYPITLLCRNLEQAINCPVNVNMYLTPGAGKKALDRHYDTHDVFVLQIHGNKIWRLYDPPFAVPLEALPLLRLENHNEMKKFRLGLDMSGRSNVTLGDEFTLKAGDCLYLPRGFWHEAESEPNAVSCHLTVGIQPTTYLDVVTVALSRAALGHTELREPLPFGFATDRSVRQSVDEKVSHILEELQGKLDAGGALGQIADHFLRLRKTGLQNHLLGRRGDQSTSGISGETEITVRTGMVCGINEGVHPPQFVFGTTAFAITAPYEQACRFITANRSFRVQDLPGDIGIPEKVALVKQLISEGLLLRRGGAKLIPEVSLGPSRWIPVRYNSTAGTVQWIDLGTRPLTEPFFHQTVQRVQLEEPRPRGRVTKARALVEMKEELRPAGFIFHMSRCGSTLLSNGLRAIHPSLVFSEPQAISDVLTAVNTGRLGGAGQSDDLLRGIMRAFGQRTGSEDAALILKFSSWNILHMARFRRLWPDVPCVIVVRDPGEVAVSCLEAPPGWLRKQKHSRQAVGLLGEQLAAARIGTDAEFCSQVLGQFLEVAEEQSDDRCVVLDYKNLNALRMIEVAKMFGLRPSAEDVANVEASMAIYSKDPSGKRAFVEDDQAKKSKVTAELQRALAKLAQPIYYRLVEDALQPVG